MDNSKRLSVFNMNMFRRFVYGAHLFSLSNLAIVLTVVLLLGLQFDIVILLIPYLITQVIYSYNHRRELVYDLSSNPERTEFVAGKPHTAVLQLNIYIGLLVFFLLLSNVSTILLSIFILFGGIAYTEFFKEFVSKKITGLKSVYTCIFWSALIFFIPSFYMVEITLFFLYFGTFLFIRGMTNTAFTDIKDIESDKERGLKTYAVKFGKSGVIKFLSILNLISLIPLFIGVYLGAIPLYGLVLGFFVFYSMYYLYRGSKIEGKELRSLSYVIVDGEYILWPIILVITKLILNI